MDSLPFEDDGELVCYCCGVSAFEIKKAIYEKKLTTVEEVSAETGACRGCHGCASKIEELIDEVSMLK